VDILLDILKESRPKIARMGDLVGCPSICKVPPTRFIVTCFQDVEYFILSHTSTNNQIKVSVKDISLDPKVWSTHFNNHFLFLG